MALPRGLINSHKFMTYNCDKVTRAEQQPLETRSDGLGAYLTLQQVGVVVLFLVENLTTPVDCALVDHSDERTAHSSWAAGCTLDDIVWHQALVTLRRLDSDLCPKRKELPADQWVLYELLCHGVVNP